MDKRKCFGTARVGGRNILLVSKNIKGNMPNANQAFDRWMEVGMV